MAVLLLAVTFGWAAELLVQTTLPLLILDRGGDAALVGLVGAVYALPSLAMRPLIGRRIDRRGHGAIHQLGAALLVVAPLGFMAPSALLLAVSRLTQGIGWAMYGTSNNVVLVRLAPPARRGQASSLFNVTWALGFLSGPPIGLALYGGVSQEAPFVVASLFAATGLIAATILRPLVPAPEPVHGGEPEPTSAADGGLGAIDGAAARRVPMPALASVARRTFGMLLEPTAVPTMTILACFMAAQTLFLAFAPVYVRSIGEADQVLATYFPLYGGVLVGGQLLLGRLSDRIGRRRTVLLGSAISTVGLLIAVSASSWTIFASGAVCFAFGASIVTPAVAAATIDRVPRGRTGVGMATYSMGYSLASGLGGAIWGFLIDLEGFTWPFIGALVLQAACVAIAIRFLRPTPTA